MARCTRWRKESEPKFVHVSCPYWEEKRQQGEGLLTENESNTVYQYKALRLFQQRNCVTVGMHDWLREWFYTWGHDRMSAWLHLRLILCGHDCICAWLHVDMSICVHMITCENDCMRAWFHDRMIANGHDWGFLKCSWVSSLSQFGGGGGTLNELLGRN